MARYLAIADGSGKTWGVVVPDFPGCHGAGATPEDAVADATRALREFAADMVVNGDPIPAPSGWDKITAFADQSIPANAWRMISCLVVGGARSGAGPRRTRRPRPRACAHRRVERGPEQVDGVAGLGRGDARPACGRSRRRSSARPAGWHGQPVPGRGLRAGPVRVDRRGPADDVVVDAVLRDTASSAATPSIRGEVRLVLAEQERRAASPSGRRADVEHVVAELGVGAPGSPAPSGRRGRRRLAAAGFHDHSLRNQSVGRTWSVGRLRARGCGP